MPPAVVAAAAAAMTAAALVWPAARATSVEGFISPNLHTTGDPAAAGSPCVSEAQPAPLRETDKLVHALTERDETRESVE